MNTASSLLRSCLPASARQILKEWIRRISLPFLLAIFARNPEWAIAHPAIIRSLRFCWGNTGWSAGPEYLRVCVKEALASQGPILECGSGLSTILVGIIAARRRIAHLVIEHDEQWASTLSRRIGRLCPATDLQVAPLRDYGSFFWYALPQRIPHEPFGLVVCDGPPGKTPGGRIGLLDVMASHFDEKTRILLDDASRPGEIAVLEAWKLHHAAVVEVIPAANPLAVVRIGRQQL